MYRVEGERDIVRPVVFKDGNKEKLREFLKKKYSKAISDREGTLRKCKDWEQQANSRRVRPDLRTGDANLDMPLTRKRMTQNASRLTNPVLQQDRVYACRPRTATKQAGDLAREVENALDYICDQFNIRELLDDWIEQFQMFPYGVLKTHFSYDQERFLSWQEIGGSDYFELQGDRNFKTMRKKMTDGTTKYFVEIDQTVDVRAGVFPEVVPFEDFIVPAGTCSIESADVIFHRTWPTKTDIKRKIKDKIYDEMDAGQKVIERISNPTAVRNPLITPYSDGQQNNPYQDMERQSYEVVEAYLEYDVNDDGNEFEIIVTFEANSGTILRAVHNFYQSYRRPFIVHQYKHIIGSLEGSPLTYLLEPLHVANSASICQRLDAASLANTTVTFVPTGSGIKRILDRSSIRTEIYEANLQPGEIQQIQLSQAGFTQLPELEDKFERSADEVSSLSPHSFGFEQVQRPTLGGTAQLIEEAKQPQYNQLERFRDKLALLARHMLSRYKQFYPEGLKYYIAQQDEEGREILKKEILEWPANIIEKDVIIETKVSSSTMSKMLRKQEVSALVERMQGVMHEMMGLVQMAADINNPAAPYAWGLLQSYQEAVNRMLLEFDIIEKEKLNPDLMSLQQFMQPYQQEIMRLRNENQQIIQQMQQILGGPGGGPPRPPAPGPSPGIGPNY